MEKIEEKRCELSDADLVAKCNEWITSLCKTGGKSWSLSVPVNFKRDPDVLFTELIKRYTTRNDEVVAIIQDRINYLDGIKVLNSHNSTRIHELTDLLTKLKEDKK